MRGTEMQKTTNVQSLPSVQHDAANQILCEQIPQAELLPKKPKLPRKVAAILKWNPAIPNGTEHNTSTKDMVENYPLFEAFHSISPLERVSWLSTWNSRNSLAFQLTFFHINCLTCVFKGLIKDRLSKQSQHDSMCFCQKEAEANCFTRCGHKGWGQPHSSTTPLEIMV